MKAGALGRARWKLPLEPTYEAAVVVQATARHSFIA